MSQRESIYIIRCGDNGPVKIGHTNNPSLRMQSLQVGCPFELQLVLAVPVTDAWEVERKVHRQFDAHWMRGEWFNVSVAAAIGAVLTLIQYGQLSLLDASVARSVMCAAIHEAA